VSSTPYQRVFSGKLPVVDETNLRPSHTSLDKAARELWELLPDQVKDVIHSFAIELIDEQNRHKETKKIVEEKNQDMSAIQNQNTVLEGSLDELSTINNQLKLEIKSLRDLNEKLKWKIKSLELEQMEVGKKLTMLQKENFDQRRVIDSSEMTAMHPNLEIENKFARVYEEKEALDRVNAELKAKVKELEKRVKATPKKVIGQITKDRESLPVDLNQEIMRKLIAQNSVLEERIIELLTANKRTSALVNILIEMRKQMITLSE